MSDAISRAEAAAIFGVSPRTFDRHIRPLLSARRFGRNPRFSRAEAEELWARGEPAAPKGRPRPAPVPQRRVAVAPAANGAPRVELTERQRRILRDLEEGRAPAES